MSRCSQVPTWPDNVTTSPAAWAVTSQRGCRGFIDNRTRRRALSSNAAKDRVLILVDVSANLVVDVLVEALP